MTEPEQRYVNVGFAVMADDIRREDNGKLLLVGVYANDVVFHQRPVRITPAFVLALQPVQPGPFRLEIAVKLNGRRIAGLVAELQSSNGSTELSPTPNIVLQIEDDGELTLETRVDQNSWKEVLRLPVTFDVASSANASEQTS